MLHYQRSPLHLMVFRFPCLYLVATELASLMDVGMILFSSGVIGNCSRQQSYRSIHKDA